METLKSFIHYFQLFTEKLNFLSPDTLIRIKKVVKGC